MGWDKPLYRPRGRPYNGAAVSKQVVVSRKLERYELIEEIGHGGMAVVYRGVDSQLERAVAVKVLHPHLQAQKESKLRFHREAKAVARLRHPNILEIYDYSGADAAEAYIVTELIHGPTLKRFWETNPEMPVEMAAMIISEVCRALEHAHSQGIIHRDVKPENVMIRQDGIIKLTDFGIAQMIDSNSMTVTGQILGSPAHMSPEHLEGKSLDFRADVFSVGTVLYMLTIGRLPFEGRNPHQVLKKIVDSDYPDPLRVRPQVGATLAKIICRCLEHRREDRYQCIEHLRGDLESFLRELGFSDNSALRDFFADPAGFKERHDKELVGKLVRLGDLARRSSQRARAADVYNRVLAIDPKNEEVLRQLGTIVRRRRTLLTIALVLAGMIGVAGAALWPAPPSGTERPSRHPAKSVPVTKSPASAARTGAIEARTDGPPRVDQPDESRPNRPAAGEASRTNRPPEQTERRVLFAAGLVRQFDIYVDGTLLGAYGPGLTTRGVPVGTHTFRFVGANDCCEDSVTTLPIPQGEGDFRIGINLRLKPALLNVQTNVPADIEVLGRARGRSSTLISVPLQRSSEPLRVVARAGGYRDAEVTVDMQPNVVRNVSLSLDHADPSPRAPASSPPGGGPRAKALEP